MNVRMTDKELINWRRVAAKLMLNGVLEESTMSALVRYGLQLVAERHAVTVQKGGADG